MRAIRVIRILGAFSIAAVLLVPAALAAGSDKNSTNEVGRAGFKTNCVVCHGADGAGTELGKSLQVPDLRSQEVQKKSDAELSQTISEGKGNMPPFKRIFDPEQIKAVVGYLRELGKSKQ